MTQPHLFANPSWCAWASRLITAMFAVPLSATALAQPSQRPLLITSAGAKPNVLVSLDNSASMSQPFPEDFSVPKPGKRDSADAADTAYYWAQRSSNVNPLYYNPSVHYQARVDSNGNALRPTDAIVFVSNAESVEFSYKALALNQSQVELNGSLAITVKDTGFPAYPLATGKPPPRAISTLSGGFVPIHLAYSTADLGQAANPLFSYAFCTPAGSAQDPKCLNAKVVDVKPNAGALETVDMIPGPGRTDCKAVPQRCTHREEMENILRWYRYYHNRIEAAKTALGLAFQSPKLKDGPIRLGYQPINLVTSNNIFPQLGNMVKNPTLMRGVRSWSPGSIANKEFYDWLYGIYLEAGTPLHRAHHNVANYLRSGVGISENAWAQDPSKAASADNPEMSCRRAFHIVFSDGAWTNPSPSLQSKNEDSTEGPVRSRKTKDNKTIEFRYQPHGDTSELQSYVPFPDETTSGGLADLAAKFYWHEDFRPDLPNEVSTKALSPTFWQNVRTYAIGYLISPSGEIANADKGLTFKQIETYRNEYLTKGYKDATKPSWNISKKISTDAEKIDDFIHSGYTGGGRSFSVSSAEGIQSAINAILSDIFDASGEDAGIALDKSNDVSNTIEDRVKFKVEYRTTDNVGDVFAQRLDQDGEPLELGVDANNLVLEPKSTKYWSAKRQLSKSSMADRHMYSHSAIAKGFEFKGNFASLPLDVQQALRTGAHAQALPSDQRFVDYLRGKDPVTDNNGETYRLRSSPIGAIVNSAPVLLGSSQRYGYDSSKSEITGKDSYGAFRDRIALKPDTLFAATNAGVVHALDSANGDEIAAYLPMRSMKRLLDQAQSDSEFQYVLDGPLSTHDIFDGAAWNELVVGSGGRGERLLYALRPRFNAQGETQLGASDFLWEAGPDTIDNAMDGDSAPFATGYMTNPARSGQTDSGAWVMVVNSGHFNGQSDGRRHGLVVLNAMTGKLIRTISLPTDYPAGRGLGGVTLVRDTRNRIVAAYAGDAMGQLWRFDLRGDPASWKVSYGKPLFTTENNRPIYAAPAWQAHPKGGLMVIAATGMLLQDSDSRDTTQREAIYGIWDPTSRADGTEATGFEPVKLDQLQVQKEMRLATTVDNKEYYSLSQERVDWRTQKGWKYQLGGWTEDGKRMTRAGERVIEQIANLGSSVVVYSTVINTNNTGEETCQEGAAPGGSKYVFNALSGAGRRAFDPNKDGIQDHVSMVFVSTGGSPRGNVLVNTMPESKTSPAERAERFVATQYGESSYENTECRGGKADSFGVANGGDTITLECPKAWSRQQYQLTRLPR